MFTSAPEMTVAAGLIVIIALGIAVAMWLSSRRRRREAARWQMGRVITDNPHVRASRKVY